MYNKCVMFVVTDNLILILIMVKCDILNIFDILIFFSLFKCMLLPLMYNKYHMCKCLFFA